MRGWEISQNSLGPFIAMTATTSDIHANHDISVKLMLFIESKTIELFLRLPLTQWGQQRWESSGFCHCGIFLCLDIQSSSAASNWSNALHGWTCYFGKTRLARNPGQIRQDLTSADWCHTVTEPLTKTFLVSVFALFMFGAFVCLEQDFFQVILLKNNDKGRRLVNRLSTQAIAVPSWR